MLREFNLQGKSLTVFQNYYRIIAAKIQANFTLKNVFEIKEIYNVYKEERTKRNELPLSIFSFSKILEDNNKAIHRPKKDQCDVCCSYKVGQVEEESYKKHAIDKNGARIEKVKNKSDALEKNVIP